MTRSTFFSFFFKRIICPKYFSSSRTRDGKTPQHIQIRRRAVLPVVHGGPPPLAGVDPDGEDAEEEEEAGHAEAHLIDGGVAHQSLAVLPSIQLLAHLSVEGDLSESHNQTTPSSNHTQVRDKNGEHRSAAPNTSFAGCHASEGARRENRLQQQQPLFLSRKPLSVPLFPQAGRGAVQTNRQCTQTKDADE